MNKIIIAREVYENYASNYYDDHNVESYNLEFTFFSNSSLVNYNILSSSLSGQAIWMKMHIRKRQKKNKTVKKKSIVTLAGTTGQRVLNKSFCSYYFWVFWVLRPRICHNIMIIRYFNQWSRSFISSKLNFALLKMRWQKFQFSAIVATKQ